MKLPHPTHRSKSVLAAATFSLFAGSIASAQITANFTDGNGTSSVDQYTGIAGNGWSSAWYTVGPSGNSTSTTITAGVTNTTPLNGGGNYLSVTNTPGANGQGDGVGRDISSANGVNLASPYTISFDFRLDSATTNWAGNDGVNIYNDSNSKILGGDNGFQIVGDSSGWRVRNGNAFLNTGVSLVSGTVYNFTIALDPTNSQYTTTITGGASPYASGTLGYRDTAAAATDFTHLIFNSKDNQGTDTISYSIDNLIVVPEPASAAVLLGLTGLGLAICRRSRLR